MKGCFTFQWRGLFFRWGATFLSGGRSAPWGGIGFDGGFFEKKCPPPWETLLTILLQPFNFPIKCKNTILVVNIRSCKFIPTTSLAFPMKGSKTWNSPAYKQITKILTPLYKTTGGVTLWFTTNNLVYWTQEHFHSKCIVRKGVPAPPPLFKAPTPWPSLPPSFLNLCFPFPLFCSTPF